MVKGQVQLQAWIDPDLREAVQEMAHVERITIKQFVAEALRLRLAQVSGGKADSEKGEATDDH